MYYNDNEIVKMGKKIIIINMITVRIIKKRDILYFNLEH